MLLPVSNLEETLERYKKWVRPLTSDDEYNNTVKITDEFKNGVAKKLHDLLVKQKDIYQHTSWISSSWLNAYLDVRTSPIISTNFSDNIKLDKEYLNKNSNEKIICNFASSVAEICRQYRTGTFEKVYDARKNEICLSQFAILRGSSRIPFKDRDLYNISNSNSNYFTLFYKNNLFKIQVINEKNELLNVEESIKEILSKTEKNECSLSTICFTDSDKAYELRKKYIDHNAFFNIVENSLFNISIFEEDLKEDEKYMFYMCLKADNTWVYKPLNFIYNLKNKDLYINCEHTYQDGGTILEIVRRSVEFMKQEKFNFSNDKGLCLKIDEYFDEAYKKEADNIKKEYSNNVAQFNLKSLTIDLDDKYFNSNLKGLSKDAVMQFVFQYAQYKAFNSIRGIYEAVDIREYQYARTECVRSVSSESLEFIKSLDENSSDVYEKLKAAELEHKNRIKNCKGCNGVNRYLLGLSLMVDKLDDADKKKANEFFNDISYSKNCESFLSTSSLGLNDYMGHLLFVPVIDKGFGISYFYEPIGLQFMISYYKSEEDKANKFFDALKEGAEKFKNIKNA